jgi:hypothetical protein
MFNTVVDNDIVLKACLYGLDAEVMEFLCRAGLIAALLPVARYVVRSRLRRHPSSRTADASIRALDSVVSSLAAAEPSSEELRLAASFETDAQRRNLELDSGESQLLAISLNRRLKLLLTGDKRAIRAIEQLAGDQMPIGSVGCLEQLFGGLVRRLGVSPLRERVCSEAQTDQALARRRGRKRCEKPAGRPSGAAYLRRQTVEGQ